jgi:flagellar transcriptional activator FlhD
MNADQMMTEIREVNLAYLLLAQKMLREDRATAMYRLGINGETADILEGLTLAQLMRMASSSMLLCRFRFDDRLIFEMLASHGKQRPMAASHAAILIAGQPAEEVA